MICFSDKILKELYSARCAQIFKSNDQTSKREQDSTETIGSILQVFYVCIIISFLQLTTCSKTYVSKTVNAF